jgi:Zn-dependent alcohol dehydrogenase
MEEVEVAPPGRLEVRVRVLFTSVCHTDLSFLKGEVCMYVCMYALQLDNCILR